MIILGIDPGSRLTGFGLIKKSGQKQTHIENGTIYLQETPKYADRLVSLYQEIQRIIEAFQPDVMAVENIFFYKNPKSVQKLAEVRGVAILSGALAGVPVFEYAPREVKKAVTGHGAATKEQMQYMVRQHLKLTDIAEENANDALGVALCHAHSDTDLGRACKADVKINRAQEILKKANFYR